MRFTLNGTEHDVDLCTAKTRLVGHPPEPIQVHWVEVDGRRWPPKQALEVITGVQRAEYTTHRASDLLHRLGFATSGDLGQVQRLGRVTSRGAEGAAQAAAHLPDGLVVDRVGQVQVAAVGTDRGTRQIQGRD